jgi:hypothetical protein
MMALFVFHWIFFARTIDRIGKEGVGARDAILSYDEAAETEGNFGFHRSMDTLGTLVQQWRSYISIIIRL